MSVKLNITTKINNEQHYIIVTLVGQIDETNLENLSTAVDKLIGSDAGHLVFNLRELEFINSKVIGYLAATRGQLSEGNQKMIFIEANSNIFDILELVGLTQIIPTLESEAHLIRAIAAEEI